MGNETQPFNAERSCQGAVRATKSWRIFSRGSCVPCRRNSLPKNAPSAERDASLAAAERRCAADYL